MLGQVLGQVLGQAEGQGLGFDSWELMKHYVNLYPLHTIMTHEYESFVRKYLPDIIAGHSRSQVMHQYGGTEHKYWYDKVQISPPVCRTGKVLRMDSFAQAFRRKSTLACVVLADVHHETREYRDCLTLEDLHAEFLHGIRGEGFRAIKGKVRNGELQGQASSQACPPVPLPAETAAAFEGKAVVIILPYPNAARWGAEPWHFDPADVFVQAARKPFPEYDERLLLSKTVTVNLQVPLFDLPLMVGVFKGVPGYCTSREERSPVTASFVVNGLAKSIFMQFRLIPNVCFVFKVDGSAAPKYRLVAEVRSLRDTTKWNSTSTLYTYLLAGSDRAVVHVPSFTAKNNGKPLEVPLLHVLLLLGLQSAARLGTYLFPPHVQVAPAHRAFLERLLAEMDWAGTTRAGVLQAYAAKMGRTPESVQSTFDYAFLGHCDYADENEGKIHFFAACLRKLAAVDLGLEEEDDRDHMANKSVQCAGQLLAVLQRQLWRNYIAEQASALAASMLKRKIIDVNGMLSARSRPTARLMVHFHSGHWSIYNNTNQGYLQLKTDTNDVGCYEQLGRVSKPIKNDVRSKKPRFCPPSALRKLCVSATPDGAPTGLVNNLAINCRISAGVDVDLMAKIVCGWGMFDEQAATLQPRRAVTGDVAAHTFRLAATGLAESRGAGARLRSLERCAPAAGPGNGPTFHHSVNINGNPVGCLRAEVTVEEFMAKFRALRRQRVVPRDASVHFDRSMHCVQIRCDIGRMMTLLLLVSELPRVPAVVRMCRQLGGANIVRELLVQGCAEFVDCFEEEHCVVALDPSDVLRHAAQEPSDVLRHAAPGAARPQDAGGAPAIKYDYCALTSTSIFGMSAAMIPSAHRNSAVRAAYHSAGQMKASLQETSTADARFLAPTVVMSICGAQHPIYTTRYEEVLRTPDSCGQGYNVVVCVQSRGYNQEDSIVANRGALDMGLASREEYEQVTVRTSINEATVYMKPPLDATYRKMSGSGRQRQDNRTRRVGRVVRLGAEDAATAAGSDASECLDPFDALDLGDEDPPPQGQAKEQGGRARDCFHAIQANGFPKIGARIEPGDIILGRVNKVFETDASGKKTFKLRCASVASSKGGVVAQIIQNTNRDCHVVVFRLYSVHVPNVGDKFTPRSGQKGTISQIKAPQDMPFSRAGIVPDLVMNPHALPSRMTVAHMLESNASKLAAMLGLPRIDGTSFSDDVTVEHVSAALAALGHAPGGEEEFYCGETGRRFQGQLFNGLVFYKVLKHLADKKRHARGARGPTVPLTRQPTEGKKRDGGLRFGEMDRDCVFAHGAAHLYHNLTVYNSDAAVLWFCVQCGSQTNPPAESDDWSRHRCSNPTCCSDNVVYIHTTWSHNLLFHEFRALNIKCTYDIMRSLSSDNCVHDPKTTAPEPDSDSMDGSDDDDDGDGGESEGDSEAAQGGGGGGGRCCCVLRSKEGGEG